MRASRATLMRATADLQAELEKRIFEGFLARIARYFSDFALRRDLVAARRAQKTLDGAKS